MGKKKNTNFKNSSKPNTNFKKGHKNNKSQSKAHFNNTQHTEEEIIPTQNNIFDFDGNTNIFQKLKGTNQRNKSSNMSSWSYSNVLQAANEDRKIREQKRFAELNIKPSERAEPENENEMIISEPATTAEIDEEEEEIANNINKFEGETYSKSTSFCDYNFSKLLLKGLADLEYFHPTKVQDKVMPLLLKGHDVLVNSETGSGKTACYLLPIIQKIIINKNSKTPIKALVLLPTRELAFQCGEMLSAFLKHLEAITFVSICGGMSIESQIKQLQNDPDIILATPGRLIDMLYNYKSVNDLQAINILVLDEADKLLEQGFKDAIMELLQVIKNNNNRQTMLFSATLNPQIVDLGKDALNKPIKIKLATSVILANLKQSIIRMKFKKEINPENEFEKRMAYLVNILSSKDKVIKKRSIIFFNTKKECHKAYLTLRNFNIPAVELHSDIAQPERLKALESFQKGIVPFLICTDIAARGIDVEKVAWVVNFQMPQLDDRYVHRIGRTARKGYLGQAVTICDEKDREILKKIMKKEKFVIHPLKIENDEVKNIYKKLIEKKAVVDDQIFEDDAEKELALAERDVERTINMKMHSNEIYNRPRKTWFMNRKQKSELSQKLRNDFKKNK